MSIVRVVLSLLIAWSPSAFAAENPPENLAVIEFATGSAEVSREWNDKLVTVVRYLRANPDRMVYVEGHADSVGDWRFNLELSQRRSDAVRNQLIRMGANPDQLVRVGHGENTGIEDVRARRQVVLRTSSDDFGELMRAQRSHERAPARETNPEPEQPEQPEQQDQLDR
jgi:hypothetical protein